MIGHLTGKIISKKPTQIILDVSGVGYVINISITTFEKLPNENDNVSLFTHLSVKEDSLTLYGFFTPAEKEMFELLISISGIGPKLGQSILSGIQISELKESIVNGNLSRIIAIPGIGRKTGERLLVELRDKISSLKEKSGNATEAEFTMRGDAVNALTTLGYNKKTAEEAVRKILDVEPNAKLQTIIKNSLALLNK